MADIGNGNIKVTRTNSDLSSVDCIPCTIVETFENGATTFATKFNSIVDDPISIVFMSIVTCWMVLKGIQIQLAISDIESFFKQLVNIFVATVLLVMNGSDLILMIYNATTGVMAKSSELAFRVLDGDNKPIPNTFDSELVYLAYLTNNALYKVFELFQKIWNEGSLTTPAPWLLCLALIIPYGIMMIAYVSQLVISAFNLLIIAVIMPLLTLFFAFERTKSFFWNGINTMLSSIMIGFICTLTLSLVVHGSSMIPADIKGEDLGINSSQFWTPIFIGWMGVAFMTQATSLANSLVGTSLSTAGAGVLTAGVGMTAGVVFGKAYSGSQSFAGGVGNAAWNVGQMTPLQKPMNLGRQALQKAGEFTMERY